MQIQIWRNEQLSPSTLCAFIEKGRAFTVLKLSQAPYGGLHHFPLSDGLAAKVLGATRKPCTHIDEEPLVGLHSAGYFSEAIVDKDGNQLVSLRCNNCSYGAQVDPDQSRIHPAATYLARGRSRLPFTNADWNQALGGFSLASTMGRLILWEIPRGSSRHEALTAAQATHHGAELVYHNPWVLILRELRVPLIGRPTLTP